MLNYQLPPSLVRSYVDPRLQELRNAMCDLIKSEHEARRQAEVDRALLESAIDAQPIPSFVTTTDGNTRILNPMWEETFGWTKGDLNSTGWHCILLEEEREKIVDAWESAIKERREFDSIHHFVSKEGRQFEVHVTAKPVICNGEVVGYAGHVIPKQEA